MTKLSDNVITFVIGTTPPYQSLRCCKYMKENWIKDMTILFDQ